VRPFLDAERERFLDEELRFQSCYRFPDLPRGPVHADLFRDNALFENGRISGVIDFYFAGVDCFLFDLAVCANDWCLVDPEHDRRLDESRTRELLAAYAALRPFSPPEREAWPVMLRAAALRFWLSRLFDYHLPRPGQLVRVHDPAHFHDMLRLRVAATSAPWFE
jgi:homoserine kinase type II